jgi:hypothetical protein
MTGVWLQECAETSMGSQQPSIIWGLTFGLLICIAQYKCLCLFLFLNKSGKVLVGNVPFRVIEPAIWNNQGLGTGYKHPTAEVTVT